MVKGTSRQVIVVHAPEEKLFEQAIFILRDGAVRESGVSDEALLRQAKQYLNQPKGNRVNWMYNGPLWGVVGAAAASILSLFW